MLEKYGDDLRDHAIDDVELWKETQRKITKGSKTNYIYGIGSSDLESLVTGKSSAASCSSSTCESQHEVYLLNEVYCYYERNQSVAIIGLKIKFVAIIDKK